MKTCPKCNVTLRDHPQHCPLCQGDLVGAHDDDRVFPVVLSMVRRFRRLFQLLLFVTVAAAVVCVAVNYLFPAWGWWSLFVLAGLGSTWLSLTLALTKRGNIPKAIIWQVFAISGLAIAWDFGTGFRGWSLDFVVPCLCTVALAAVGISARILRLEVHDYIMYIVLDCLFGLIPLIFLLLDLVRVAIPSVVCVAASVLALAALWIFEGAALRAELRRRTHL